MDNSRANAIKRARALLEKNPVILDTETTGLDSEAQICEIALMSADGTVILDQRVRPTVPIQEEAAAVHGITDADVADMPGFEEAVRAVEKSVLANPSITIAGYNAPFDLRLIDQSYGERDDKPVYTERPNTECIMDIYSAFHGEYNQWHRSFTWQPLDKAAAQCRLSFEGEAHSALADAKMTLALLKYMASRV